MKVSTVRFLLILILNSARCPCKDSHCVIWFLLCVGLSRQDPSKL